MNLERWLSGDCMAFAEALALYTGWKPALVVGINLNPSGDIAEANIMHGVLRHPEGGLVDAEGRITEEHIAMRYGYDKIELTSVAAYDFRVVGGHDDGEVDEARAAIENLAQEDAFFADVMTLSKSLLEQQSDWLHGNCFPFAEALARLTALPPAIPWSHEHDNEGNDISVTMHAAVAYPNGGFIDAEGHITEQRMLERYDANIAEICETTFAEMHDCAEYTDEDVFLAQKAIYKIIANGDNLFAVLLTIGNQSQTVLYSHPKSVARPSVKLFRT